MSPEKNVGTPDISGQRQQEFGVQIFPIADRVKEDAFAAFDELAAMGYHYVETAGLHGHSAATLKAAAQASGLQVIGMHVQPQFRFNPEDRMMTEDFDLVVEDLQTLGASRVVMPLCLVPDGKMPARTKAFRQDLADVARSFTLDDWQRSADFLNRRGRAFQDAGITLYYHNHNLEFAPCGGKTGWDVLWDETDKDLVHFELDIGWIIVAGLDPVKELQRGAGRVGMIHIKDTARNVPINCALQHFGVPMGQGKADWSAILRAAQATGVDRALVEVEGPYETNSWDATAQALRYLRTIENGASAV